MLSVTAVEFRPYYSSPEFMRDKPMFTANLEMNGGLKISNELHYRPDIDKVCCSANIRFIALDRATVEEAIRTQFRIQGIKWEGQTSATETAEG